MGEFAERHLPIATLKLIDLTSTATTLLDHISGGLICRTGKVSQLPLLSTRQRIAIVHKDRCAAGDHIVRMRCVGGEVVPGLWAGIAEEGGNGDGCAIRRVQGVADVQ